MHVLIGIAMAVALLYFWLIGHWFARILVCLLFGTLGVLLASGNTIALICAVVLAWPLASLPSYYWQRRARQMGYARAS